MKKVLLVLVACLLASTLSAQVLWSEGFSDGIPTTWTMFNDNNISHNEYQRDAWVVNQSLGNPAPAVVSASWFDPAGVADRWLITNSFTVPDSGYFFELEAACYEEAYPDGFMVKVSTTDRESRAAFTTTIINVPAATASFEKYRGSLDAFIGQTIYIAVIQNSNDMNFIVCDNFKVYIPAQNDVDLVSFALPSYAAINNNLDITGTVKNMGVQDLTSFDLTYSVNGGTPIATTVSGINIQSNGTYNFTHDVPFFTDAAGNYEITVTVSNPNGVTDPTPEFNTLSANTIAYDPATTVTRTSVLENFTTAVCQYCPAGHDRIHSALENTSVNTIWVCHHAGFYTDALTCPANEAYMFFYNANSSYAPAMMVDRYHGDPAEPGPVTGVGDVSTISQYLTEVNSRPSFVTLNLDNLNYNPDTRAFSGTVTGRFTNEVWNANTRLTLMVLEDSNVTTQSGATGNYMHFNACRATLTDTWGDPLTVNADGTYTYNVSGTLPANLKAWRCRVVAIISNYNSSDPNDCAVMQAATTANLNAPYVGIGEANEVSLNVYPNPATDYINIEAGSVINEVRVYNPMGQEVYTNNNVNSENLIVNMQDMATGMYMVTIRTDKGVASHRISVVR